MNYLITKKQVDSKMLIHLFYILQRFQIFIFHPKDAETASLCMNHNLTNP